MTDKPFSLCDEVLGLTNKTSKLHDLRIAHYPIELKLLTFYTQFDNIYFVVLALYHTKVNKELNYMNAVIIAVAVMLGLSLLRVNVVLSLLVVPLPVV
jgi:hypothetical protein